MATTRKTTPKAAAKKPAATRKAATKPKRPATVAKPAATRPKTISRTAPKDYTAVLTAVWLGLIVVFIMLILFKLY